jgi:hypothetical protein
VRDTVRGREGEEERERVEGDREEEREQGRERERESERESERKESGSESITGQNFKNAVTVWDEGRLLLFSLSVMLIAQT